MSSPDTQTVFGWSAASAGPLPWDQLPSAAKRVLSPGALLLLAALDRGLDQDPRCDRDQ